jgi:multidrug resistance efflux pump
MKKATHYLIAIAVIAVLILSACGNNPTPAPGAANAASTEAASVSSDAVIAEGHLTPVRDTTLSFQGSGTVVDVKVKIGDKVKDGDELARLGGVSDAAYAAAQLQLVNAKQELKALQDNADAARAQALIDLDNAQEAYDKAVDYYDTLFKPYSYDKLVFIRKVTPFGVKMIPDIKKVHIKKADEDTVAEAQNDMDLKLAQLEAAQRVVDRTKDGPDTDQLALLQARLNAAETGLAAFSIVAPFDGVVTEVNVADGEQVSPQTWAVKMADTSSWNVETSDVTELEVVNIQEGQKVTFTADALPGVTMNGVVQEISQSSYTQNGDVIYTVKIKADDVDPRARWGMTVEVTFPPLN